LTLQEHEKPKKRAKVRKGQAFRKRRREGEEGEGTGGERERREEEGRGERERSRRSMKSFPPLLLSFSPSLPLLEGSARKGRQRGRGFLIQLQKGAATWRRRDSREIGRAHV